MSGLDGTAPAPVAAPAPSAPAPVAAPAPTSTQVTPAAAAKAERARDATGKFTRHGTAAKRAILEADAALDNEPQSSASAPPQAVEKTPVDPDAVQVEAKAEAEKPAAEVPAVSDDPKSWPAQAQAAHRELSAKVQAHENELSKWHEAGPKAVAQNVRLHEENKLLRGLLEQAQIPVDQRDLDLIRYRTSETTAARMAEAERARGEAQQAQQQEIARARAADDAKVWVDGMNAQARAAGVDPKEVAERVYRDIAMKREPDIAAAIQQVKDLLLLKQRQVNASAPTTVARSVPTGTLPKDRSPAGKLARLQAQGFDLH